MPVFAAYDAFLKINTLRPATSDASHSRWLKISGFSWGANAPAGGPGCASNEARFTVPPDMYYYFKHAQDGHELIPEATIEYMNTRHQLENVTVRAGQGNTVALHFARCLAHPPGRKP